jgi:hypothetical protein
MLIPILTIWAGTFPIVVSKWAAIGLTIYSVAQTFVLNFMRKRSHYEPIWFATIANNILWWTFVKACWKSLLSLVPGRAKITFKTTMKGAAGLMANSAIGDLWMPAASFVALAVTLGIGIKKLVHGCVETRRGDGRAGVERRAEHASPSFFPFLPSPTHSHAFDQSQTAPSPAVVLRGWRRRGRRGRRRGGGRPRLRCARRGDARPTHSPPVRRVG